MNRLMLKTGKEFEIMAEGGEILARARRMMAEAVRPGITALELDAIGEKVIREAGAIPAFQKVPGYKHATCINVNEVVVHGIPDNYVIKEGDKVAIDVGVLWNGYNTDGAVTVRCKNPNNQKFNNQTNDRIDEFLKIAKIAWEKAIRLAVPGNTIWDLSNAMQEGLESCGYSAVRALTGHGIGKELHEEPSIPCFRVGTRTHSEKIVPGMALAIEIMANMGTFDVVYKNDDGWTIVTADGKISALFEETVAITSDGNYILTQEKH